MTAGGGARACARRMSLHAAACFAKQGGAPVTTICMSEPWMFS
ncbi:protein of unknown function [Burkholderia multivorans]